MIGDVLDGRYELVERLGQGGFGVVWRAFDSRMRRPVAVKVINHHGEDQQKAALRFVREACAAGNLSHPHIVTVHDLGEGELGGRTVTYLVMELITGRTLTSVLRDGPPGPERSVRWGRQICSALAAAHDAGMVHRDIKPENIMVTEAGTVKVLDFGIAQLDIGAGGLTTTGTVVGSPAYMAPERWTGGRVDGRADLYAFGCVLVELCTGVRPFSGDSTPVLMYQHLNAPPPALDPAEFGLPADLAGLVTELLAKDPEHRPADARTVERRLADLEGEGPSGKPVAEVPAVEVPVAEASPAVEVPAVEVPAEQPGFGPVVVLVPPVPVFPPPVMLGPVPVLPPPVVFAPGVFAPGVLPPLTTPPSAAPHAPVRAALSERRSAAHRAATPEEAAALLHAVAQEALAALGPADRETLAAWRDFAWFLSRTGDLDGAIRLLSTVAEDLRVALGPSDPDTLTARYHLLRCIGESGETVSAMRRLAELLPELHTVWGPHDPRVFQARHDLAAYTAERGDLEGAVLQLRTLLPELVAVLGEQHPLTVHAWQDLAARQQRLAAAPAGRPKPGKRPRMHPAEALALIRRVLAWEFASEKEADACLDALERGTGIKQIGEWILAAPDHVTAEDLVEEIYGP
ncbi:serine/threonine-protein kinase [Kitasatospora purpeofusca]|uniref:serine/threonine-protein kinase n=1 Tax=Kitasatospora purpeofusca TaxID=67352 RepID=UPI000690E050|nr:serine/threonine-protein kinase [Kitasatospora purpeofusca]